MTGDWPFVSVVVVTVGRLECLVNTLSDLARQDYPRFDITVVDQNPEIFRELAQLARASTGLIRIVRQTEPNMCAARNLGINETHGEMVLFVDDDIRCGPSLLREHVAAFRDREIGGVGGWIEADRPEKIWKPREAAVCRPIGCNMSFRREVLERVGGFDPHIAGPAAFGDEVDIAHRVRQAGYRIAVAPRAVLTHLAVPAGGCRPDQNKPREYWMNYARNQALVYLKTHSLPFRMALPFWLIRFCGTARRLSGGTLAFKEFGRAVLDGVSTYRASRGVRTYLR